MNIINRAEINGINDTCGIIQQLFDSDNLTVSYAIITGKAKSHLHRRTQEVYYIEKGRGNLFVGSDQFKVSAGDVIPLPKHVYHHLEKISTEPLELLVVTHPRYDPSDVIEEK